MLILDEHNWEGLCDHLEKLRMSTLTFYSVSILSTIVKFEMIGHHGPCGGFGGCHRWFFVSFHLHGDMACLRALLASKWLCLLGSRFILGVGWLAFMSQKQPKNILTKLINIPWGSHLLIIMDISWPIQRPKLFVVLKVHVIGPHALVAQTSMSHSTM